MHQGIGVPVINIVSNLKNFIPWISQQQILNFSTFCRARFSDIEIDIFFFYFKVKVQCLKIRGRVGQNFRWNIKDFLLTHFQKRSMCISVLKTTVRENTHSLINLWSIKLRWSLSMELLKAQASTCNTVVLT